MQEQLQPFTGSSAKAIIDEYQLNKSQLAFTLCRLNQQENQQLWTIVSTVFSQEMIEGDGKETNVDNDNSPPTNDNNQSTTSDCRIYKYTPRCGFPREDQDMMIILTNKVEPRKYGGLYKQYFLH